MSTFFEKLTGQSEKRTGPIDLSEEPKSTRAHKRVMPAREEHSRSTHLRVAAEDEPDTEEPEEEEGELTVDIYQRPDGFVIQSTVAGVKPEDLDVSITNDTVTIRGKRQRMEEVKEDNYYYKELFWGTFSRSVILPEEIEEDEAEATLKHGLLSIFLPKKKRNVVQKLKVKVS